MLRADNPWPAMRRWCVALTAILMLFNAGLIAQTTISTGSIVGTVTDPTGAVVSGAKVVITNLQTGQVLDLSTNPSGAYNSGALPPGEYRVQVSSRGFSTTAVATAVQVGNTTAANVRLQVGQESQTVEVAATAALVNTEQPTVQGVLTSQQIETLPLGSRNFLDLAQLEPGVQVQDGGNFDPTKNGFSSVSFGGRYGRTARIELDGIDISDETVGTTTQNISAGAIDEFQISQSTLDLSTELTSSGAVNVVTKSGTNTVHGDAFYLFRDKALMANFPGGQDTYYQRNHFGGSLGGPLIKDKLFFFANGERLKQASVVPLAPPAPFAGSIPSTYPGGFKDTTLLGKLDWRVKPNMTVFYRFTYEWNGDTRAYGSTYQPFTNRNQTPAHGVGWDFSTGNFTHSVRFGYEKFQNHIADAVTGNPGIYNPGAPGGIAIRVGPAGVVTRFGPSRLAPQATFQGNYQLKYDGSHLIGSHVLRYGVSFNRIRGGGFASFYGIAPEARTQNDSAAQLAADAGPFPGGRANPLNYQITGIFLGNGQGFSTETPAFGYPAGGQFDNRIGLYVGDSWKIKPNFTLTYGVRWSRDTGRQDSDLAPLTCDQIDAAVFAPFVPCTGSDRILDQFGAGLGARVNQPNKNFGPQVGFAWDPARNGKTVIRGGAGIYYENAVFNNVLFDRPGRLPQGLFLGFASPCPGGKLNLPGQGTISSIDGLDIASQICGQPVGNVMTPIADMERAYQAATASAGAQANGAFIGENLAMGATSTGNGFIAPNYKTPYSIQMNLGIQRELRTGMVLSADFIRNVGLHYLIAHDTNHVGDARYLNTAAALNAISATNAGFGCGAGTASADIQCAIGAGATITDYASNGLDSGADYLAGGFPASAFGLTPNTGAAFAGINNLVGNNDMLFPSGRSTYTGLQTKLVQNMNDPLRGVRHVAFQVSYALSRFNTMAQDQDFIPEAWSFSSPGHYYGPGSLDRTHQISFGGTFDLAHGPRFSIVSHFFSPLSNNLAVTNQARPGEIFFTDYLGDGAPYQHIVPGQQLGSWGRSVTASNVNSVVNKYNSTVGGTLLPAANALVNAGLFTSDQLISLGATADYLALAPSDQMNMSWLHSFDFKFAWPMKIKERFTLEPSVGFYNLFNFANFNAPGNLLGSTLGDIASCASLGRSAPTSAADAGCQGSAASATGTSLHDVATKDSLRVGTGTGANTTGAPRQIDFGLKVTF
jgi:Carboxypeptidase regulatory-like domain